MQFRNTLFAVAVLCSFSLVGAQEPNSQPTLPLEPYRPPKQITIGPDYKGGIPHHEEMIGKTAPDLTFQAPDGSEFSLRSYRGKPVLIDFWATWCGPCLTAMPHINEIYSGAKKSGLVIVSFDEDHEPEKAAKYLAAHHYAWMNFHDEDNRAMNTLQGDGLPLAVLIDAQGRIVYFDFGNHVSGLQSAIASLGPEFASIVPKKTNRDPDQEEDGRQ